MLPKFTLNIKPHYYMEQPKRELYKSKAKTHSPQNNPHHYEASRRLTRPLFPYHDPGNLREGEREYNDSVNGHPSAYLPFWRILGVHLDKSNNTKQLQPSN